MSRFFCACFWPSRPKIPEEYLRPQGLYSLERVDLKKLRRLIRNQQLAPCHPGIEEPTPGQDLEECPICFLHYPVLNSSLCCQKRVCTECFLQVQTSTPPHQLSACPFCKVLRPTGYLVKLIGARTAEEREQERLEEQKVIEARIREREEEVRRDQERALQRAQQQQQEQVLQQQQQQNAAAAVAGAVAAAAAAASPLDASAAAAGTIPASRSPRPRPGTAGLPVATTQSLDHYQSPRLPQAAGLGPSVVTAQRINSGHLSAAGASDAATTGSQARGGSRAAAAGSSGGSAPGSHQHRQHHGMEPCHLEGRVQQSRAAQQQQLLQQQRGSYPGSGFTGQQQQVYAGGRFRGPYEVGGGAGGGDGVPAALAEEPQHQQLPAHHRRRQSGGRRYRLTDYVPAGVVDIAMGLNDINDLDDINDLMLEQAMYESLAASAAAAQPAPAVPSQPTADAAAAAHEGSQYDAELAAGVAASMNNGGGRGADGEQSGAHHNHHQSVRQQQVQQQVQQQGQHPRQHGVTDREQRSHQTHTALQHRPAAAGSRSLPVTPRGAAPATSVFTFAAASALHGPNAAAAAAAQGMARNGAGRRPTPTSNTLSTMGGEAPSLAPSASPQAQSPQSNRAACQDASQLAINSGVGSAGAVLQPPAAARPLSPLQHSSSGRGGAGGSMEVDLDSGQNGAGGGVTRSGATVDGSRSTQHPQGEEEEEALGSRRMAAGPPAALASPLISISSATVAPVAESSQATDVRTAHGAAGGDVSPTEPAGQPSATATVKSTAGPVAERHLTNPLYDMWLSSSSAANVSTVTALASPNVLACKYLSGDIQRGTAELCALPDSKVTPPTDPAAAAANDASCISRGGGKRPEESIGGVHPADDPRSVVTTDIPMVAESIASDAATNGTTAVTLQSLAVELLRHSAAGPVSTLSVLGSPPGDVSGGPGAAGPHAENATAAHRPLSPSSSSSSREATDQQTRVVVVGMVFFSRGDGAGTSRPDRSTHVQAASPLAGSASPVGGSNSANPLGGTHAVNGGSDGASSSGSMCPGPSAASSAVATVSYPIPGQPAWVENPDGSLQILMPPAQSPAPTDQPTSKTGQGQKTQCDGDIDAILNMPYVDYTVPEADSCDDASPAVRTWRHEESDAALVARIAQHDAAVVAAVAAGDVMVAAAVQEGDRR